MRKLNDSMEIGSAVQLLSRRLQLLDRIVDDVADGMWLTRKRVDQSRVESKATCSPFVLSEHHGMAVVLISPAIDLA